MLFRPVAADRVVGVWEVDPRATSSAYLSEFGGEDGTIDFLPDGTFVAQAVRFPAGIQSGTEPSELCEQRGQWELKGRNELHLDVHGKEGRFGFTGDVERTLAGSIRIVFWVHVDLPDRYVLTPRVTDRDQTSPLQAPAAADPDTPIRDFAPHP
ncbi:hypothetical protein GCM10027406_28610 [Leifsonia lichenia]